MSAPPAGDYVTRLLLVTRAPLTAAQARMLEDLIRRSGIGHSARAVVYNPDMTEFIALTRWQRVWRWWRYSVCSRRAESSG